MKTRDILLVEDEQASVELMVQYMEALPHEYRLSVCAKASEALVYAKEHPIALFLLDIQLLDYRGTQLAKQLRGMPEYRFTPMLFTTELAGEELSAYREIKCYDFLVKPFTKAEFLTAVQAALDMEKQMQAAPVVLRIEQKRFRFEYDMQSILYMESFGKQIVIHTMLGGSARGADRISGYSLSRLLELTGPDRFLQCHKSFLVNSGRIYRIDKGNRLLFLKDCDTPIPIGEKYMRELLECGAG